MLCSLPDFEDHFLLMHATACSQLPLPAARADSYQGYASTLVGPYHCGPRAPGTALHLPLPPCCASHATDAACRQSDSIAAKYRQHCCLPDSVAACQTALLLASGQTASLLASGQTTLPQNMDWTLCELCDAPEPLCKNWLQIQPCICWPGAEPIFKVQGPVCIDAAVLFIASDCSSRHDSCSIVGFSASGTHVDSLLSAVPRFHFVVCFGLFGLACRADHRKICECAQIEGTECQHSNTLNSSRASPC